MYEALEAEQSVISCLIQRAESVEDTYSLLSPEMFDSGILGKMYLEFRNAFDNHKELTLIELHQILQSDYQNFILVACSWLRPETLQSPDAGHQAPLKPRPMINVACPRCTPHHARSFIILSRSVCRYILFRKSSRFLRNSPYLHGGALLAR